MSAAAVPSSPLFDRDAAGYDALRRRLIPCFDGLYGAVLDLIADWHPGGTVRGLDLGAGTGLLSGMILDRHPDARLQLVDASTVMLDRARHRFGGHTGTSFVEADLATAALGGPWDLIVSALAIHHLVDDAKRDLFRRIHAALVPGGLFVDAERVHGPTPATEALYARRWLHDIRAAGVPEDEIGRATERMAHDRCATVEDQVDWMRGAGLVEVDCTFKAWRFAVLTGRRAGC